MYHLDAVISKKEASKDDGADQVYTMTASTPDLDRDGEILVSLGANVEEFEANPQILLFHDRRSFPIGKGLETRVTKDAVEVDFVFIEETREGKMAKFMYDNGFMNSFSVGAKIDEYITQDKFAGQKQFEVKTARGSVKIDTGKHGAKLFGIIPNWTLREVSAVTIPANPNATLKGCLEMQKHMIDDSDGKGDIIKSQIDRLLQEIDVMEEVNGIVPFETCARVFEDVFNATKALAGVMRWASSDSSGNKDTVDWAKMSQAFCLYKPDDMKSITGYQFLHHVIVDDELATSKMGVFNAMSTLLAGKDDMDEEKFHAAYQHLCSHYAELNVQAPALKESYTEEELENITKTGGFEVADDSSDDDPAPTSQDNTKILNALDGLAEEFLTMRVLMEMMSENLEKMAGGSGTRTGDSSDPDDDEGSGKDLKELLESFKQTADQ